MAVNITGRSYTTRLGLADFQSAGESNLFHAEVNRTAMTHEWQAGTDVQRGDKGFYASLDGTLGWLGNHLYAMRNVPDAFAVVDTNGVPDIPVKLHNNTVGRTDEQGYLLLTDLNGWLPNQIAIDPCLFRVITGHRRR